MAKRFVHKSLAHLFTFCSLALCLRGAFVLLESSLRVVRLFSCKALSVWFVFFMCLCVFLCVSVFLYVSLFLCGLSLFLYVALCMVCINLWMFCNFVASVSESVRSLRGN
jgi:hypothetical protein